MKAVFLDSPGHLEVRDIHDPSCPHGMVRVQVEAVAVCDDDLAAFRGALQRQRYPIIPGRESVGRIVDGSHTDPCLDNRVIPLDRFCTGARTVEPQEGDLVVIDPCFVTAPHDGCRPPNAPQYGESDQLVHEDHSSVHGGSARAADAALNARRSTSSEAQIDAPAPGAGAELDMAAHKEADYPEVDAKLSPSAIFPKHGPFRMLSRPHEAIAASVMGLNVHGALREYMTVRPGQCTVVPSGIAADEAVFVHSTRRALFAAEQGVIDADETVAVVGAHDVGLIVAQIARALGAQIVLVDSAASRLELGRSLGFEHTVNPTSEPLDEKLSRITGGRMADCTIETTGDPHALGHAISGTGRRGRIVLVHAPSSAVGLCAKSIVCKELTVLGCDRRLAEPEEALELLHRQVVRVDSMVSTQLPLEAAPFIIPSVAANPEHYMRVLLHR